MPAPTFVYEWLELWDQLLGTGGPADLDAFVRDHCREADPGHVATFRRMALALLSVNPHLRRHGSAPTPAPGDAETGPNADYLAPGREPIAGYRLDHRRGGGGYGEVWRADGPDGRGVAIKFVRRDRGAGAESRGAELLSHARHPHLIEYLREHTDDRHLMLVMELADRTVAERLAEARATGLDGIPRDELLGYMAQAADALDFLNAGGAGRKPAQHRDVKPGNLLLLGGTLKVGDFGLARPLEHTVSDHTGYHTCEYAPPEFFKEKVVRQSDQYSLAVTYCQLRGGRLPFEGTRDALMHGHLSREPDLTMLPPAERPIVRRALAKTPRHRWPSCTAFVTALRDGVDAVTVRRELIADLNNVTLRRLYLSVRTEAQLRADKRSRTRWPARLVAVTTARYSVAIGLLSWLGFRAAQDSEGRGWWPVAVSASVFVVVTGVLLAEVIQRSLGVRRLASEFGPIRYFPFPYVPLDEIRDHYSRDRDADDPKDPIHKNAARFGGR